MNVVTYNVLMSENWQKDMTAHIGKEVRRLRGDRSTLWLEKTTEQFGFKVSRTSISQLENGNRTSISVAEWLVLSAALEVPPAILLYPDYPYGIVNYLPGIQDTTYNATDWISGRNSFVREGLTGIPRQEVYLFTEIQRLKNQAIERLIDGTWTDNEEAQERYLASVNQKIEELEDALENFIEVRRIIRNESR